MSIPTFERNCGLRFSKVGFGEKRPLERNWPKRPYSYSQIRRHREIFVNYGVLCGYGALAVVDADHPDFDRTIQRSLPQTFSVRTGKGGHHYYYHCSGVRKRIVLDRDGVHFGEVQSRGQQVVGPGSVHPNGRIYTPENDRAIAEISVDELSRAVAKFRSPRVRSVPVRKWRTNSGAWNNAIPITDVIDTSRFRRGGGDEIFGANPWHGSASGRNLWINVAKNVGYCFRHQAGISVVKAIALNRKIIADCSDWLTRDQYQMVCNLINSDRWADVSPRGSFRDIGGNVYKS